jgi:hypothetical protein
MGYCCPRLPPTPLVGEFSTTGRITFNFQGSEYSTDPSSPLRFQLSARAISIWDHVQGNPQGGFFTLNLWREVPQDFSITSLPSQLSLAEEKGHFGSPEGGEFVLGTLTSLNAPAGPVSAAPEPALLTLLGSGLISLGLFRGRRLFQRRIPTATESASAGMPPA